MRRIISAFSSFSWERWFVKLKFEKLRNVFTYSIGSWLNKCGSIVEIRPISVPTIDRACLLSFWRGSSFVIELVSRIILLKARMVSIKLSSDTVPRLEASYLCLNNRSM